MTHLHIFHLHNAVNELTRLDLDDIQEVREIIKHTDTRQELDQAEFLYTEVHLKSGGVIKAVKDRVLDIDRWIKEISPGPEPPSEDGSWVSGTWLPHWKAGIDTIIPTPDPYTRHLMHPADRELVKRAMTSLAVHSFSDMMKEINDFLRRHDLGELQ